MLELSTDQCSLVATTTPKSKMKEATTPQSEISNGVADMSLKDTARAKSKNLDVVAEYKKIKRKNAVNFVVIGEYIEKLDITCSPFQAMLMLAKAP